MDRRQHHGSQWSLTISRNITVYYYFTSSWKLQEKHIYTQHQNHVFVKSNKSSHKVAFNDIVCLTGQPLGASSGQLLTQHMMAFHFF